MELDDLDPVPATAHDVVVELVPPRQGGQLRAREPGDGAEVETVDRQAQDIYEKGASPAPEYLQRGRG